MTNENLIAISVAVDASREITQVLISQVLQIEESVNGECSICCRDTKVHKSTEVVK